MLFDRPNIPCVPKTSTFIFFEYLCQKLTDFTNFWYVKSWENLTWTPYRFIRPLGLYTKGISSVETAQRDDCFRPLRRSLTPKKSIQTCRLNISGRRCERWINATCDSRAWRRRCTALIVRATEANRCVSVRVVAASSFWHSGRWQQWIQHNTLTQTKWIAFEFAMCTDDANNACFRNCDSK